MSERGEWSQFDEEPDTYRCAHCHGPLDSEHESLCANCRVLADTMPGLVVCEGCGGENLERTNNADTMADYAVWCRMAGKGVDPLDTYPLIALGLCMPCVREQMRDREVIEVLMTNLHVEGVTA